MAALCPTTKYGCRYKVNLSIEVVNALLLLLPGFMSGQIYYSLFRVIEVSPFRRTLEAIIFSFILYLCVSPFFEWEPLAQVLSNDGVVKYRFSDSISYTVVSLVGVVLIPLIIGFCYFNDHIHRLLRKLTITTKSSRGNTWNDVLASQERYVVVILKDGRRIRGYPTMFSDDPSEGYLYLYNPAWLNDDKENDSDPDYIESYCHGYLLNRDNIDLIGFTLDDGETLN